jgi:tRNA threonylcarbamoyladenosine biosynthesis protein TsaB
MSPDAPLVLAVESATPTLSAALLRGDALVAERVAPPGAQHAETLLPLVVELLDEAGLAEAEVGAFGVSIGPGSFTSLRVGLATVKGLAFGTSRPAVAVSTLAALAWGEASAGGDRAPDEAVVALLDAHRGEVYAAVFDVAADAGPSDAPLREVGATGLFTPAELGARLPARCVLVGDGTACLEASDFELPPGARLAAEPLRAPSASGVGALAGRALLRGEGADPADLVPRYVRRAEAEVTRTAQRVEP